eukprot:2742744-Pyramimonas_sp.AAC.1
MPATGIFSLPFCDWCLLRVYSGAQPLQVFDAEQSHEGRQIDRGALTAGHRQLVHASFRPRGASDWSS